jgi:hypothetical protein
MCEAGEGDGELLAIEDICCHSYDPVRLRPRALLPLLRALPSLSALLSRPRTGSCACIPANIMPLPWRCLPFFEDRRYSETKQEDSARRQKQGNIERPQIHVVQ